MHGVLFFAWTLLFAVQTLYVGRGRVDLHRAAGMLGISLATAMVFTAAILIVPRLSYGVAIGNEATARSLAIFPISQISMFAVFVAAAVANVRRPETHKRLMVLATISLLPAAVARILGAFLVPGPRLPNIGAVTDPTVPMMAATIAAGLVDLVIVAAAIFAYQRAAALKSALDLDLFTAIADGGHTAAEVATGCHAPVRGIRILCDYLTTIGFLSKSDDRYELTPDTATFLSRRSPAYIGDTAEFLYSPKLVGYFDRLTQTIRRGGVDADTMVADENPAWVQFARAMVPMMMPPAQAIADLLGPPTGPTRVLDLAAGHGMFGIVLAQRHPKAEIVAQDWAPVLEVALEHAREMGVADRYRTLPGSAFDVDYGTGYDVVLVTNFLHHFDPATNVGLLKKVHAALVRGGRVVVLEFVPNEDRISPPMAARFSLTMLSNTPQGDAYTFGELRSMLLDAGFRDATLHAVPGPHSVVLGVK